MGAYLHRYHHVCAASIRHLVVAKAKIKKKEISD
jgi:hypothetical protein